MGHRRIQEKAWYARGVHLSRNMLSALLSASLQGSFPVPRGPTLNPKPQVGILRGLGYD